MISLTRLLTGEWNSATLSLSLQDAQAAFNHFRDNCARARTIEDNKRVLKEKYNLAKELAERVNATRG